MQEFCNLWLDENHDLSPTTLASSGLRPILMPDVPDGEELNSWCSILGGEQTCADAFVYEYRGNYRSCSINVSEKEVSEIIFGNFGCYRTVILKDTSAVLHCDQMSGFHIIAGSSKYVPHFDVYDLVSKYKWRKILDDPNTPVSEVNYIVALLQKYRKDMVEDFGLSP